MKKVLALVIATAMMLSFAGCGAAPEEEVLTLDDYMDAFGVSEQTPESEDKPLSFEMIYKYENNPELVAFIRSLLVEGKPASCDRVIEQENMKMDYHLEYDGKAITFDYIFFEDGKEVERNTLAAQSFGLAPADMFGLTYAVCLVVNGQSLQIDTVFANGLFE